MRRCVAGVRSGLLPACARCCAGVRCVNAIRVWLKCARRDLVQRSRNACVFKRYQVGFGNDLFGRQGKPPSVAHTTTLAGTSDALPLRLRGGLLFGVDDKNDPLFCGFSPWGCGKASISPGREKVSPGKPTEKWGVFITLLKMQAVIRSCGRLEVGRPLAFVRNLNAP